MNHLLKKATLATLFAAAGAVSATEQPASQLLDQAANDPSALPTSTISPTIGSGRSGT